MALELIILLLLLAATVVLVAVIWFFGKAVSKNGPMSEMALQKEQDLDEGYIGVPTDVEQYLGKHGKALTVLRPAGKIEVGGAILDAVSVHDFIEAGEAVVVTKYENTQLYVMRAGNR